MIKGRLCEPPSGPLSLGLRDIVLLGCTVFGGVDTKDGLSDDLDCLPSDCFLSVYCVYGCVLKEKFGTELKNSRIISRCHLSKCRVGEPRVNVLEFGVVEGVERLGA